MTIIVIEDDLHEERAGYYRAFYADDVDARTMSPMVGYAMVGGVFKTIKETAADARRRDSSTRIFRRGKELNL